MVLLYCRRSLIFWSDTMMDTIHQAEMNGENDIVLVNSSILAVGKMCESYIYSFQYPIT